MLTINMKILTNNQLIVALILNLKFIYCDECTTNNIGNLKKKPKHSSMLMINFI